MLHYINLNYVSTQLATRRSQSALAGSGEGGRSATNLPCTVKMWPSAVEAKTEGP